MLFCGRNDFRDWLLDADVYDLIAVIGEDDIHQVLADVVHVAANCGQHDCALASLICLLHVWFEKSYRGLHHLGGLQHEWELHLALTKALTDNLHALEQMVVDNRQRGDAIGSSQV